MKNIRNFFQQSVLTRQYKCDTRAQKTKLLNVNNGRYWRNIFLKYALPLTAVCAFTTWYLHEEIPRPEFIPYEYLRIRNKRFPWGDGEHSLFHNFRVNALPNGYEENVDSIDSEE